MNNEEQLIKKYKEIKLHPEVDRAIEEICNEVIEFNKWHFYPENTEFLKSKANKTFDEVLKLTNEEFRQWIIDVRKTICDIWDNRGIPPVNGYSESEIVDQFNQLQIHNVKQMWVKDELTGMNCIRNTHNKLGNACNSWFPTMMKTKIDYGTGEPKSIYDFLKEDSLLDRYMPYGFRHFKRDSFYAYSQCVPFGEPLSGCKKVAKSGKEWVMLFEKHERDNLTVSTKKRKSYDYWISEKEADTEYTGYDEKLIGKKFYQLSFDELNEVKHLIPSYALNNIKEWDPKANYIIRLFEKGQKIFPGGLKSFRISVCQSAVNFPPTMAKAIWEKYTNEWKDEKEIVVWDPSSGWGGRILGAMSVRSDRHLKYLGTDPNTDHTIFGAGLYEEGNLSSAIWTKYDDIAEFVNTETLRSQNQIDPPNEWKIWQCGSEVVQNDKDFQRYKGKVSVVFTSPPYFGKEQYSQDETQSCHKFDGYLEWKNGFLYETLKTAYDWLRPGGYIIWNISDIKLAGDFMPLEKDSCDIMESLGMKKVETLGMVLAQMPGSNRTKKDESGKIVTTNKNEVKIDGKLFRMEPIFVYRKP